VTGYHAILSTNGHNETIGARFAAEAVASFEGGASILVG
jgi:hypothetical protein